MSKEDEEAVNNQRLQEDLQRENKRMIVVQVNTSLLKTKLKLILREEEPVSQIMNEVAAKLGDSNYLNPKQFILVPSLPKDRN